MAAAQDEGRRHEGRGGAAPTYPRMLQKPIDRLAFTVTVTVEVRRMLRSFSSAIAVVLAALVLAAPAPVHSYGHTDKVPVSAVRSAHIFFRSPGRGPDPVLAENQLRLFALNKADPVVDRNLPGCGEAAGSRGSRRYSNAP